MAAIAENPPMPQEDVARSAPDGPVEPTLDAEQVESNWTEVTATFDDMDLKEDLLRGIYAYGFEKVSPPRREAGPPSHTHTPPPFPAQRQQKHTPACTQFRAGR